MVDTRYYPEHCSLSEALDILLGAFSDKKLKTEKLPPRDALGMILAGEVSSKRNVPHYTASAVDGYTMTSVSTAGASAATPVELAGASWVNTGMPVGGGDAVIMVEDTSGDSVSLKIYKSLTQGENVRALGEDVMNGQLLACRGDVVTPALVSLFLCAGVEAVTVYPRPRAIFIPTGNEIVTAEKWLSGDKIDAGFVVDSNSVYAAAMFESWGYSLEVGAVLPDDPEVIADAVSRAAEEYDLVLVSAGSAKGRRDHSADVFTKLGRMLFRYVRMKPGRPVMAADIGGTPVICSPGFPMSCAVALWSLVYPLLRILSGDKLRRERDYISEAIASTGKMEAELMTGHSSAAGVFDWLRVKCADVGRRRLCWPLSAGASVLWALAEADGIVTLPEQSLESPPGTKVTVRITRRFDIERRILFQGSDDPAVGLLAPYVRAQGMDFVIRAVGSMGGLAALGRGEAHVAAAHLLDSSDGSYNTSYIERFAQGRKWERKLIFRREQGIITQRGNPKNIRGFEDIASGRITFENRQPGAGTRVLLDYMLKEQGLTSAGVVGYDRVSITHMEAANKVASGVADVTLGIKAAADALNLHFIPIAREPYELVFCEDFAEHIGSRALMDAIDSPEWREAVKGMGGYEFEG